MSRSSTCLAFLVSCLFASSACSNQPEGGRCDTTNGNDDCETGLVCTPASKLNIGTKPGHATSALCCPDQRDLTRQPIEACFAASSAPSTGGTSGAGGTDSGAATGGTSGAGGTDAGAATGGAAGADAALPRDASQRG
jgi:hypothetical protein